MRSAFGPKSVGVIGSVVVRHVTPVDFAAGGFYAFLRRYGVDPGHEANRIAVDFGGSNAFCGRSRRAKQEKFAEPRSTVKRPDPSADCRSKNGGHFGEVSADRAPWRHGQETST